MRTRRFHTVAYILALAAVYFFAGKFGLSMAFANASASAVWPPTGIALAALLLWGHRLWPGVFLGAFLVNITTQGTWVTTLGIATGNTLEVFLGAWLVNQFANGRNAFEQARDIFKYILLAVILSTTVSATFGATSLALSGLAGWNQYLQIWVTWWTGDAIAALILTPLIVLWCTNGLPRWSRGQLLEALMISACVLVIAGVGFYGPFDASLSRYLRFFLYPAVLLAAYRFGEFGAINCVFAVACVAIAGTRNGLGPFASANPEAALLLLQAYLGTFTVTNLILGALVSDRKRTEQRLRVQEAVSRLLAESSTLREATPKIIQALCEMTGWDMGAIWRVNRTSNELFCVEFWRVPAVNAPEFEAVTRQRTFAPGIGLPGRVWSNGQPEWIVDVVMDPNFPRAPMAMKEGLHSGFAFPFKVGGETLGILECFSRQVREPDRHFLDMLADIGGEVGQFIERRRAEEALRGKEAEFRLITEITPVLLTRCSRDLRYLFVNRAYAAMLGLKPEQIIGKPIVEVMGIEGFETIRPHVESVLKGQLIEYEQQVLFPKIGQRLLRVAYIPDTDEQGKVRGWVASISDMTERKRGEEARATLAAIVESSDDAIISKNLNGIVTSWNVGAERMFGYAAAEMIGQSITRIVPPERADEETVILNRLRRGEHVEHFETVRVTKQARAIDVSLTISPLRDTSGKIIGIAKIVRDISERKRYAHDLEQQVAARTAELRETNSQLEAFVYSVAHDLRGPLRTMQGVAEILLEEYGPVLEETGRAYTERVKQSAHFMDKLLLDLLEFSRVSQGELKLEPVSLGATLDSALHHYQIEIEGKKAHIEVRSPLPSVLAHPATLGQVLANLLSNALKFSPPGVPPRVCIRAEEQSQSVRLWVEDNGVGIKEEHQERIFRIFERLNGNAYTGTGIGLAIVRKGVERMRGRVGVESTPGEGSRFWIELATG